MTQPMSKRSELKSEFTWDAHSVFSSDDAWETAIQEAGQQLAELSGFEGHLGDRPEKLADWLEASSETINLIERIYVYASMFYAVDTADAAASARHDRARSLYAKAIATIAFAEPELLAIGFEQLRRWIQEERLAIYGHYLDELERRQAHVRSAEVEEILGRVTDPFAKAALTHSVLTDADLKFRPAQATGTDAPEVEIAQGTMQKLLSSPDRTLRQSAWENYADAHLALKNTMASCLITGVKQNVFTARARRYGSALEAALSANHIPEVVFHNTIETFRRHLPTWRRYWQVRRKALGVDKLHPYDIRAPLTTSSPQIPFEQSVELIVEGMRPLGEEYVTIMRRGLLEQRWVDIYPNQGKTAGAFSSGVKGTHPFILMSFSDDIFSLSTLAHELGHSMHSYYSWRSQPYIYSGYSIFVAEVASNFSQALVRAYLLQHNNDPEFQIAVIEEAMANFHRYFFIMPTLARFELEIHQREERGEALTADSLIALLSELFKEGYGDEVELDPQRVGITWAEFPHHLYANFYVYQYTTGIAAAHALAAEVLAGKPGVAEKMLAFLKAGGALYPLDALKLAGVDMATPEPLEKTFTVLAQMVDRLESLVDHRLANSA